MAWSRKLDSKSWTFIELFEKIDFTGLCFQKRARYSTV